MKKPIVILFFVFVWCTFYSCSIVYYEPMIRYDENTAVECISEIKEKGVIVLIPTEHDKRNLLRKTGKTKELERTNDLLQYIQDKLFYSLENNFFCPVYFMPDSLYHNYKNGIKGDYFVNGNREFVNDIKIDTDYKLLTYNYKHLYIVKDEDIIPYPFPNRTNPSVNLDTRKTLFNRSFALYVSKDQLHFYIGEWSYRLEEFYQKHQ